MTQTRQSRKGRAEKCNTNARKNDRFAYNYLPVGLYVHNMYMILTVYQGVPENGYNEIKKKIKIKISI